SARIPRRVAFATYGFDIWCTDPVPFPSSWNYLPLLYPLLLKPLHQKATLPLKPPRPPSQQGPIVIHIGTSDPRKEWSLVNWKKLILSLRQLPYPLLFTGRGKREQDHLAQLPILPGESLLDRQDFRSFSHTIKEAKLLISVDSVSVHLAARWQTPFVALYLYNETLDLWVPKVEYGRSLTHVPITPDQVLQAAKDLL
ncbi:MAG: glycosyltransferase family 9 protein, partial [Chlamydiae bacterium]|nr:glycosyltransferase family 9 protein [Chlamydiota bacterium]